MSDEFRALTRIPERMAPWHMRLDFPYVVQQGTTLGKNDHGQYVVLDIQPATIEQHHQVTVVDEGGDPLPGVWVIFGYPGSNGPLIPLEPKENYWFNSPKELVGNAQRTNMMGYAQHTLGQGGEDIFVWDLDADSVLKLSSVIVRNCTWITTEAGGPFNHSGVHITFQRRRAGVPVMSRKERLDNLEAQLARVEADLQKAAGMIETVRGLIETGMKQDATRLENLELRLRLVEERIGNTGAAVDQQKLAEAISGQIAAELRKIMR